MQCVHYPICITTNWWPSVDAGLTDIVRMAPWPCHFLFCAYRVAIHRLWIAASESLTNYLIHKSKNCGGSIDTWGVVALTQTILPIKSANNSIMGTCRIQPLYYTRCNTQNYWRSVDAHFQPGAVTMSRSLLRITAANTLIMGNCRSTALGLYKMQHPKSLTLCWHSVEAVLMLCWRCIDGQLTLCWRSGDALLTLSLWCSSIDTHNISYKGCQYFDYG